MPGDFELRVVLREPDQGAGDPVVVSTSVAPRDEQADTAALQSELDAYKTRVQSLEQEVARLEGELELARGASPSATPPQTPRPVAPPTPAAAAPTPPLAAPTPPPAPAQVQAATPPPRVAGTDQAPSPHAEAPAPALPTPGPARPAIPPPPPIESSASTWGQAPGGGYDLDSDPTADEIAAMRSPTHAVASFVKRALGVQEAALDFNDTGSAFDSPQITDTHLLLPKPWYKKFFK